MPTPPSTSSSSAGLSPEHTETQYKVVRKRNRIPLSCNSCRTRKLKCDRKNPCDNCTKRGDAAQCTYATANLRKRSSAISQSSSGPEEMQNRIDRLESLVLNLMTNGQGSAGPVAATQAVNATHSPLSMTSGSMLDNDTVKEEGENGSDTESVTNSFGVLKVDNIKQKSLYIAESHWHMILANIAEVKSYFQKHEGELMNHYKVVETKNAATSSGGPPTLFASYPPATEGELRAGLPSQMSIEKLTTRFFSSQEPSALILHWPTYHKRLREHFRDPTRTTLAQLALLYAVISLAMQSYLHRGDEPPELKGRVFQLASEYRTRTVQCLVMSDYTNPIDYTIEALCLYIVAEYTFRLEPDMPIWTLVGIAMRLSMRMGYHRDPKLFPGLSPFKAEMRRRVWHILRSSDIIISFTLGLPSMMGNRDCDTGLPLNVFEDELHEDMKELPLARPKTEATLCSQFIAKIELCEVFGQIVEQINSIKEHISYDEVMRLDSKLTETRQSLPPHLRLRPMDDSSNDSEKLIMDRYNLDLLYQKSVCVLHRKYLTRARTNPKYAHSRRACVEAGMEILHHQALLHRESQIGGRMRSMKWAIARLTKQDYLLGACVVCLDLYTDAMSRPFNSDRFFWTEDQKREMYRAIETSEAICSLSADVSMDAFKASRILRVMLDKIRGVKEGSSQQQQPPQSQQQETRAIYSNFDTSQPEHSAAMTLGMLSTGSMTPNTAAMFASAAQSMTVDGRSQSDMTMPDAAIGMPPYVIQSDGSGIDTSLQDPFNQVFGGISFMGSNFVEMPNTLDWDAWDSYVQSGGGNPDSALQFQYSTGYGGAISGDPMTDPYTNNMFVHGDSGAGQT